MEEDKKSGKSVSDAVQIIVAVLSLVGVLGGAVISSWDKLFPQKPSTQPLSESNKADAPFTAPRAHPPRPSVTTLKTNEPLFVVVPSDIDGASIGARITSELQREGLRIAKGRDSARLLVEIQAPDLGSTQVSPIGGLEGFSVVTTLTAKISSENSNTGTVASMQRQAVGIGTTAIEARQNSIAAVTDRLGKTIADALK